MLGTATKLQTARTINGTSFNGTGNITTAKWGTARTIGLSGAVSGSASVDGSGNVTMNTTQANIIVIEDTMVVDANTNDNLQNDRWSFTAKTISYPSGYNKSNCIVLAFGTVLNDAYTDKGYAFGDRTGGNSGSSPMIVGDVPRNASLYSDGIHIWIGNYATSQKNYKYKIILMKTS